MEMQAMKFGEREDPMHYVAEIFGRADVATVHAMGQAIEAKYSKSKVLELIRFMRSQGWDTGDQNVAMITALAASLADLARGDTQHLAESFTVMLVAHLWATKEDVEDQDRKYQPHATRIHKQAQNMHLLFPSSAHATAFCERSKDFLGDPNDPLEARSVGPYVRLTSVLLYSPEFRADMTAAAKTMGGDVVPNSAYPWKGE
jgi:hypothetical protein